MQVLETEEELEEVNNLHKNIRSNITEQKKKSKQEFEQKKNELIRKHQSGIPNDQPNVEYIDPNQNMGRNI